MGKRLTLSFALSCFMVSAIPAQDIHDEEAADRAYVTQMLIDYCGMAPEAAEDRSWAVIEGDIGVDDLCKEDEE